MDKNEFFREATLRICGNLEIEKAMVSFLQYIQKFIPSNRLFLERYDKGLGAMRTIVDATPDNGKRIDVLTPLSQEAKAFLKKKYGPGAPDVYYYKKPHETSVARELLAFHKQEAESLLVLPLGTFHHLVGSVILVSEKMQYTSEHSRLISLLKEPFGVAMSNALKHREVIKLKDLLADDNRFLHEELLRLTGDAIVGANFGLKDVMHKAIKWHH